MGRDALEIRRVTFTTREVLDSLKPTGPFGSLILRNYRSWLNQRQPHRYSSPTMAEHWREYQFRKVVSHLNYLSEIMLDKERHT